MNILSFFRHLKKNENSVSPTKSGVRLQGDFLQLLHFSQFQTPPTKNCFIGGLPLSYPFKLKTKTVPIGQRVVRYCFQKAEKKFPVTLLVGFLRYVYEWGGV